MIPSLNALKYVHFTLQAMTAQNQRNAMLFSREGDSISARSYLLVADDIHQVSTMLQEMIEARTIKITTPKLKCHKKKKR